MNSYKIFSLSVILVGSYITMGLQMFLFPPLVIFFIAAIGNEHNDSLGIPILAVGLLAFFAIQPFII